MVFSSETKQSRSWHSPNLRAGYGLLSEAQPKTWHCLVDEPESPRTPAEQQDLEDKSRITTHRSPANLEVALFLKVCFNLVPRPTVKHPAVHSTEPASRQKPSTRRIGLVLLQET